MNPDDPESAHRIVAEYAASHEHHLESGDWPARIEALPYPKQTIKAAIRTSFETLTAQGRLTGELREFLEGAYVSLADYVGTDLAQLMTDYRHAGTALAADHRLAREKTHDVAWQTLARTGSLAGQIAKAIADDAALLEAEFRRFADPAPPIAGA
jgi:hypothetical protein